MDKKISPTLSPAENANFLSTQNLEAKNHFGSINWTPLSEEYNFLPSDEKTGLKDFLYGARDLAASSLAQLFGKLDINQSRYQHLKDLPLGIESDSDIPGVYDPGIYGIIIGRDSDAVADYDFADSEDLPKLQRQLSVTIAHEMIHALQTVPSLVTPDSFDTIGNTIMGWSGLEEGMAEALANIATMMSTKNASLEDSAVKLEHFCIDNDLPATAASAHLIQNLDPSSLSWYLTPEDSNQIERNNKFQQLFGSDYNIICQNFNHLYDHEIDHNPLPNETVNSLLAQTSAIIDRATTSSQAA